MENLQRAGIRKMLKDNSEPQLPPKHILSKSAPTPSVTEQNLGFPQINKQDAKGNTPLHRAVDRKDESRIKKLVQAGADLNAGNKNRETPLYRAAKCKDKDAGLRIIKYLIDHGADVYGSDYYNKTFLHLLLREDPPLTPSQFHDITAYLIGKNHSELFNNANFLSVTPFQFAVYRVEIDDLTLDLLHKNGVDMNAADELGRSVLFWALNGNRSPEFLSKLIKFGANLKHRNNNWRSLLHQAAHRDNLVGLKFFLSQGLSVNAVDINGDCPLHYAIRRGKEHGYEMARLLLENGAETGIRNKKGVCPVDYLYDNNAIIRDKEKVKELLKEYEK